MAKITEEEFFNILHKSKEDCNGYDMHLQYCWKHNRSKSIFYLTGLNFSVMLGQEIEDVIKNPSTKTIIIPPEL
jgi:hypothetical protein